MYIYYVAISTVIRFLYLCLFSQGGLRSQLNTQTKGTVSISVLLPVYFKILTASATVFVDNTVLENGADERI